MILSLWPMFLSCQESKIQTIDTNEPSTETEPSTEVDPQEDAVSFLVVEQVGTAAQLALRNTTDWENGIILRETTTEAQIKHKDGYYWLLSRGEKESIVQYDPTDVSTPKAEYTFQEASSLYPSDVAICDDRVFVTTYYGTDILVLNADTLSLIDSIPLDTYADNDGFSEAASVVCKSDHIYVSLHRYNQNEATTPPQIGSMWVMFDAQTLEEVQLFPDQGYKSMLFDIPTADSLGSVVQPHIDVTGTPGFWIYDLVDHTYRSQIYFIYNDKTIFDTVIGNERAVHLAYNYADNATWAFCHAYTPDSEQPANSAQRIENTTLSFDSITMNSQDDIWMAFHKANDTGESFLMSVNSETCHPNEDQQSVAHRILDWELVK